MLYIKHNTDPKTTRQPHSVHPLRKLMLPHIPFAIALNTIGREMGSGIPGANTAKTTSLGSKIPYYRKILIIGVLCVF